MTKKKTETPKSNGSVLVALGEKKSVLTTALPIVKALTAIYGAAFAASVALELPEELVQQVITCADCNQRLAELIELELEPKKASPKKKPVAKKPVAKKK